MTRVNVLLLLAVLAIRLDNPPDSSRWYSALAGKTGWCHARHPDGI